MVCVVYWFLIRIYNNKDRLLSGSRLSPMASGGTCRDLMGIV